MSGHGCRVADDDAQDRDMAEALRTVLKKRRSETGLSQEKLAERAGIDWKYYQALESGWSNTAKGSPANPTLQVLRKLAEAYGISVPDLMWDVFGERGAEFHPQPRT